LSHENERKYPWEREKKRATALVNSQVVSSEKKRGGRAGTGGKRKKSNLQVIPRSGSEKGSV